MKIENITGMDRQAVGSGSNLVIGNYSSTVGTSVVLNLPAGKVWVAQPEVGDYCNISSSFAGITAGFYQVTSANATSITMLKLAPMDSMGASGMAIVAVDADILFTILKPVIDGLSKSLEISGNLGSIFRDALGNAMPFSAYNVASSSEYKVLTTIVRGTTTEEFVDGGEVAVKIGCSQDNASIVISDTKIDFKVSTNIIFSAPFAQFKTLADLVDYINSQSTFSAIISNPKFNSKPLTILDRGTFGISSDTGYKPAMIKWDAFSFNQDVNGSTMAYIILVGQSGLPEEESVFSFLSGGLKGATTSADIVSAIDVMESVTTNFIVPLISQDADADIALGQTDSHSTYAIDAINSYVKSHAIKMSTVESRKNRIALVSKNAPYADVKNASASLDSFRVAMAFQDAKVGTTQYQSWMNAVIAAGMQAAAGYKGIVKKFANEDGVIKSDFNANQPAMIKDALKSGLLVLEKVNTGGFRWVSDQMTYNNDNSFVYNSLQAVYLSDLMTLTLIANFDRAVVGKSVVEMTASGAKALLEAQMSDFLRMRWISPSDDAPSGFKNINVKLVGGVMKIAVEVKLAGLIYFVPIALTISQVTQTA